MADRFAHALDLPVPALVQRQLEPRRCQTPDGGQSGQAVLELDALREGLQGRLAWSPVDVDLVHLLDAVARMRETVGERAVVRQQQRARRVGVEPADRD